MDRSTINVLPRSWRWHVRLSLWLSFALAVAATLLLTYRFLDQQRRVEQRAFQDAQSQTVQATAQIDHAFGEATALGNALARDLETGALPYSAIEM